MNTNTTMTVALVLAAATPAIGSITWDGARFIRSGLAEWYDDIGGNNVSNIYFQEDGNMLYTGNASTGGHWLNEEFSEVGVYDYTFLASNNLGNTSITVYDLELNFDGVEMGLIQASTTSDFTGGLVYISNGLQIEVTLFSFDILPIGAGGVDEVANLNSTPDGFADIVGQLQFTVTNVPAPASVAMLGLCGGFMGTRRRR